MVATTPLLLSSLIVTLLFGLSACGPQEGFFVEGSGASPFGLEGNSDNGLSPPPPRKPSLAELDGLIEELTRSQGEARNAVMDTIVMIGKPALKGIGLARLRNRKDPELLMDLLYIENRIHENHTREALVSQPTPPTSSTDATTTPTAPETLADADYGVEAWFDDSRPEFDPNEVEKFVLARLDSARKALADGDAARARAICEALMVLVPHSRLRKQIQHVLANAQVGTDTTLVLVGNMRLSRFVAQYADAGTAKLSEPLTLTVFIKNRSRSPVDLKLGKVGVEGETSLLTLVMTIDERDADDSAIETSTTQNFALGGELLRLEPNQTWQCKQTIETLGERRSGGKATLCSVSMSGVLRPASAEVIEAPPNDQSAPSTRRIFRPINLGTASVTVLPEHFPLHEAELSPIVFLERQISESKAETLFLLAPFIKKEEGIRAAIDVLLADTIESSGITLRRARLALARKLSGKNFGDDIAAWRKWWQSQRTGSSQK